jgi:hypothetical protein
LGPSPTRALMIRITELSMYGYFSSIGVRHFIKMAYGEIICHMLFFKQKNGHICLIYNLLAPCDRILLYKYLNLFHLTPLSPPLSLLELRFFPLDFSFFLVSRKRQKI